MNVYRTFLNILGSLVEKNWSITPFFLRKLLKKVWEQTISSKNVYIPLLSIWFVVPLTISERILFTLRALEIRKLLQPVNSALAIREHQRAVLMFLKADLFLSEFNFFGGCFSIILEESSGCCFI